MAARRPPPKVDPNAPTVGELLDSDPHLLCGVAALFDALRVINERDPEFRMVAYDGAAIEVFIHARRDGLLAYHFPHWKSRRMLRNEKKLAAAAAP